VDFDENNLSTVTDLIIPTFQPLAMLKTTLDTLNQDLETLVSTLISDDNDSKLWLDIELANTGLLSDLQPKITALVKDFPVEVLLVRRQKQVRQRLLLEKQQDHSTLNELTLDEVFDSRLQQEAWLDDDTMDSELIDTELTDTELNNVKSTRKEQLQTLFKQTVAQVLSEGE